MNQNVGEKRYKRTGGGTKCKLCPDPTTNKILLGVGFIVMIIGSAVMVYLEITSETSPDETSDALKKIIVNFLQMVSLAGGLPLQWPETMELMFQSFSTLSSAGTTLMIPDCELTYMRTADAFYIKQIAYTFSVPIIVSLCIFVWSMIFCCCQRRFELKINKIKDYTILSIVLMLFLCFPMLVRLSLSMLKCPAVGGFKMYLMADLQEQCFTGRHAAYISLLTVPQLCLYVLGLPLLASFIIFRNKKHLHEKKFYTRYGLLYMGYRKNREWWELVIALRKISIVMIGTFGTVMGVVDLQAYVALFMVFLSIVAHLIGQPFDLTKPNAKRLHDLEFLALTVCWCTFYGGLLFYLGHEKSGSVSTEVKILTTFALVIINCMFLIMSAFAFVREYLRDRRAAQVRRRTKAAKINNKDDLSKIVPINNNGNDNDNGNGTGTGTGNDFDMTQRTLFNADEECPSLSIDNNRKHRIMSLAFIPQHHLGHFGDHEEARNIHDEFHIHEENLKRRQEERQRKSRRNTNLRMAARKKIKQTKALSKVPMFQHLDESAIETMVNKCSFKRWKQGDVICRQGDEAECLYIIASGNCSVSIIIDHVTSEHRDVGKLAALSFFGESAIQGLGHHGVEEEEGKENEMKEGFRERNATVTVVSEWVDTLALSREIFRSLLVSGLVDDSVVDNVGRVGKQRSESNHSNFNIPTRRVVTAPSSSSGSLPGGKENEGEDARV